jgi:endo-1,4-beta-xylanase
MGNLVDRRGAIAGMAAAAVAGVTSGRLAAAESLPDSAGLNALARARGLRFGSAVGAGAEAGGSFRNPRYAELLRRDCGLLVAENEMKWQHLRPSPGAFRFADFDAQLAFAESHGMAMRGHTLLWHRPQWMPAWLESHDFGVRPATTAERLLTQHIDTVTARYAKRIQSYDVVNETVMEDGALAQTALSRAIGGTLPLVDLAFRTARQACPDAQLVYNDYMGWEPGNEQHRAGVLRLLEGFRKRGVPVDALGLQSHLRIDQYNPSTRSGPRQERAWRDFIETVVAMDYQLVITELDVNDQALPADTADRDASVAAYAKAYLDLMFSFPQLRDVLVWGLCDRHSWLQDFKPLRTDGIAKRPCAYDADYRAKPLRAAIAEALRNAPAR